MMNKTLRICLINTLLIILSINFISTVDWKAENEMFQMNLMSLKKREQTQQKYQKIKDDIKEIKEIINDLPIADPIVDTELNSTIHHGGKELVKKTYLNKLVTLDEKALHNKASDLSPYGKKWREIVHIEDEYNAHNSSMVIHMLTF